MIESTATFSECRRWRYSLRRSWSNEDDIVFIGLNPSTADEKKDDPTIRRCIGFAKRWGYGGLVMLNLFAYRSTDPSQLYRLDMVTAVGARNFKVLEAETEGLDVICAWGGHGELHGVGASAHAMLRSRKRRIFHLGLTKGGQPRHPLYLRGDLKPQEWR